MFLPHFDVICDLLKDRCTATWNLFVLYNKEFNFVRIKAALFHVSGRKWGAPHFENPEKKPFDAIYDLYKMKRSHWLLALAKNCDWFRQITPLSNLTRVSLLVEGRIELRNLQFFERMLEKSSQFLSLDQPNEPKSLDVALNIAGVEKYARKTCDCGQPGGHSIRVLNEKER